MPSACPPYCAREGDTPKRRRRSHPWRVTPHGMVEAPRACAALALPCHRREEHRGLRGCP